MEWEVNQMKKRERKTWFVTILMFSIFMGGYAYGLPVPGGSLEPTSIPKYQTPLVIPPAMPRTSVIYREGKLIDYYEIAVRQFQQQILPTGFPQTTVWSYGSRTYPATFNYPAFTIEAKVNKPVRVKWINDLVDANGNYLPHLFAVDQTLHWANPPGGIMGRDMEGTDPNRYTGPVPIVTHVHGAHVTPESDGYPESWWLPNANNIPAGYATVGTYYDQYDRTNTEPGTAVYQYRNDQRATTLWYHDHALGMTRLNVMAGPAGFYLLRGGTSDYVFGRLPGPAPALGDRPGKKYYEIPIVVQDRSFNSDGSLFFPDNRAFFEGLLPNQLQIPFISQQACNGPSDVHKIWNPEFFGNTMVVNGKAWPFLQVEQRRYRFRLLNGCNARTLMLKFENNLLPFYQIGSEGGFLPEVITLSRLQIAPAERADVIVDFSKVAVGTKINLLNIGPDFPFGGGIPGVDFPPSDPNTTGQVMQFEVIAKVGYDRSTPPMYLFLPKFTPLGDATNTRRLSLNELDSNSVFVRTEPNSSIVLDCNSTVPFGPIAALLGTVDSNGVPMPMRWMDAITENPALNSTEIWEIHNFTVDAHPIHLHLVQFQVLDRTPMRYPVGGPVTLAAEPWERGYKDTVVAYPGQITRIKAKFDIAGRYVWHCHIIDHEDNEMMRPYFVGPMGP